MTLTLLLYAPTLHMPLYSDDLLQVPWVEATPLLDFWTSVGPYRDYRPLHFTLWKALYLLAGDLSPVALHALNLAGHAACGTLVGLLAARRSRRPGLTAPLAAAFFVSYPFACDAVPWAIAFTYPLTTALALGAVLAYLRARQDAAPARHALAVVLTTLAGFAHEGGVVICAIILGTEWAICRKESPPVSRWPVAHLVASTLPLVVAAAVRPQGTALHGLAWPDAFQNAATALQTLAFPAAPLAQIVAGAGVEPALAMVLVGLPVLLSIGWLVRSAAGGRAHLLALGWWAAWSLPPLLTLRHAWLVDAPRTFYPAAAGAALLWAGAADWKRARHALSACALLTLTLLPAERFVVERIALHRQVGALLWDVVAAAEDERPILAVNLPGRITSAGRTYPLGHEGIIPMPREVGAADLVAAHTGQVDAAFERSWGPVLPPLPYAVRPLGETLAAEDVRAAGAVFLTRYDTAARMRLEHAGRVFPPQPERPALALFGAGVRLLSVTCAAGTERLVVTSEWQALAPVGG
ncbi:MAG: hypothetical protein JXD18_00765, partial [Anaerolineae bacterium]|nr:hypothetical protein [Anaerolineae bacterium]